MMHIEEIKALLLWNVIFESTTGFMQNGTAGVSFVKYRFSF